MNDGISSYPVKPCVLYMLSVFFMLAGCRPPPPLPPLLPLPPPEVNLRIRVLPLDATITFHDRPSSTGALQVQGLPPGGYAVRVERAGFQPLAQRLQLTESSRDVELFLAPLPQPVSVTVSPSDATLSLSRNGEQLASGEGSWSGEVLSGALTVTLTREGYNDRVWETFVDAPLERPFWLDRSGQIVEKVLEFESGHHPKGLRFSPDGRQIWASFLGGPPSVAGYDVQTGAVVHELTLGDHGAVEVIYSRDGERVYASQMETASVYEIDRSSGEVLRTLPTHATWSKIMALSPDGDRIYVSNWVSSDITELDLSSGEVLRELRTVETPRGLWIDATSTWLYVVGFGNGRMERIELSSGRREQLFDSGGALRHIVGDRDRNRIYISDMSRGTVWLHEPESGSTTRLARTDANPNTIDLTPDGRLLMVSCRGQNNRESYYKAGPQWGSVLIFDALTGEKLDAIVAGNQPTALDISDDGSLLAFSDMLDDRISVYRIPPHDVFEHGSGGRAGVYKRELWKGRR